LEGKPLRKGTGFEQPPQPHQHWHIDVSYTNVSGTFYYLSSVLDGYSRSIVHWDLRESMTEAEIEILLQRARQKYRKGKPRIISENDHSRRPRFQRVHSHRGDDARANIALLSAIKRQVGAGQVSKI
jgi:transposase InsO family protein